MPKVETSIPDTLRPYIHHGVELQYKSSDKEALGQCPFCGRESKFSVNIKTGVYRCFVCAEGTEKGGGNHRVFIRKLWEMAENDTVDYEGLVRDRGLLQSDVLIHWKVVRSPMTQNWMIPGFGVEKNLNQLYSYRLSGDRMRLLPTPTMGHHLHGVNLYDSSKPVVYLCEGPWDALALWEVLSQCKISDGGLAATSNISKSLLAEANVLAVPGCGVFFESWLPLFSGKSVMLMYDSDHPKHQCKGCRKAYSVHEPACIHCGATNPSGKVLPSSGLVGMQRVAKILSEGPYPPAEIQWLSWGDDGYDPNLSDGYDVRDFLSGYPV